MNLSIGVFDSGIGGEAVAMSVRSYFPRADVTTVNDRANLPYGDKTTDELRRLTDAAI
jgi:glutamate racemase